MKRVFIDSKKGVVMINGKKIPRLLLRMIRGGVGKSFVVKHYKGGRRVITKYPDMSGIVASEKQKVRRDLFREAVVYAQWIVGDEERKKEFRKTLPRKKKKHVYQAAIRLYMSMLGDARWLRKQLAVKAMVRSGERERWPLTIDKRGLSMENRLWAKQVDGKGIMVHGFEQPGRWKVMGCRKENGGVAVLEDHEQDSCLAELRI